MGFTAAQRNRALDLFHERGATAAAAEVGCHRTQIYRWLREAVAQQPEKTDAEQTAETQYQTALRQSIRRRLLEKVDNLLDRFDQPHYDYRGANVVRVEWESATAGDIRAYATSIGILIDKYRLEMGEATARTYHEGTDDIDRSVRQLVGELESRGQAPAS